MSDKLYENEYFYIEKENAIIPWVKIFSKRPYKELSDCDPKTQAAMLQAMLIVEETMRFYYNPKKNSVVKRKSVPTIYYERYSLLGK